MKQLKSEKAKVKLKAKKAKQLPKGLNVTNPSFKVKKIVIREQLKQHNESDILSKRKLNVKDLLTRLQHHNSTVRQEAVKELKEILTEHAPEILNSQFGPLIQGIAALSLDKEKDIRRNSFKVLSLILGPISGEQLIPYCDVLISYLRCAMTHIDPYIKEDALLFLDILIQNCSTVLAKNSQKILLNFLDMISKLRTEMKPGRQLTTTINSKNTSFKWRMNVLERLANMFNSIVLFYKSEKLEATDISSCTFQVTERLKYIPVYSTNAVQNCEIDFEQHDQSKDAREKSLDGEALMKYAEVLMPLIFDSWVEACPDDKNIDQSCVLIPSEAAYLLRSIVDIIQLITECIEMLDSGCDIDMKFWFKQKFQHVYTKLFFTKFPYNRACPTARTRKRQQDFSATDAFDGCLEQNFGLCRIYIWFTSISRNKRMPPANIQHCNTITNYLNDKIINWTSADNVMLPQLIKVLRTLFLNASKIWHENSISLDEILHSIVRVCQDQSKREMQRQFFAIISDIIMDHTLHELHEENALKQFISVLPNLLLKSRVHDNTIQMINTVVLRYRQRIREELVANHDAIIENAKKIDILGSANVQDSRLMICNLFYFMDSQIYY